MDANNLWSLRLGFSTAEADKISDLGFSKYLKRSLRDHREVREPKFITRSPKTRSELKIYRKSKTKNELNKELTNIGMQWRSWLVQQCYESKNPFQEKLNLFWQNHFVVTSQKVKMPYWIYQHYQTINDYSLGNYKDLVTQVVRTNAMIKYLDNNKNVRGKLNENLARELLELFTLGEGHYTEEDIKNTAKALAGLNHANGRAQYRKRQEDNSPKTIFGATGNFKLDEVIDLIFKQPNTPYFITEKILKWFIYDTPPKELVQEYGDILKQNNFELQPFFETLFTKEYTKQTAGSQIKNPLTFTIQLLKDVEINKPNYTFIALFLSTQSMDLYNQLNVKGWGGGKDWLTSQIFLNRQQFVDFVLYGNKSPLAKRLVNRVQKLEGTRVVFHPQLEFKKYAKAQSIIADVTNKMVFEVDENMQLELNNILLYDFDAQASNANQSVLNVYRYLARSAEFQII
ncbi:DUF1800 domain-containing protein [Halosquirtibacter xylanolyticus]|uniref:DUF1800 domain-containing protein n=1 Tax=Halosquirtibacter xylanolyticus TaxID=3374599 RepID=UPI003749EAC1|nr:DUF1800 domain-containing protein [Prolixibacteraceae bacterium]